jgi:hypothetical protein
VGASSSKIEVGEQVGVGRVWPALVAVVQVGGQPDVGGLGEHDCAAVEGQASVTDQGDQDGFWATWL